MASTPTPTRARKRPRDSLDDEDEEHALDAMLVELGIPDSGSKKKKQAKQAPNEVIELLTPPRDTSAARPSVVDLTTSPASPNPSPSTTGYIATVQEVEVVALDDQDEVSFSSSPSASPPPFVYSPPPAESVEVAAESSSSPEILSPDLPTNVRRQVFPEERENGPTRARRLSGRLRDLHSETTRSGGAGKRRKERDATVEGESEGTRTTTSPVRSRIGASPSRPRPTSAGRSNGATSANGVIAVVQMERSLNTSAAGDSIREALKNHVYNGKRVPFTVATALNCIIPGVIRWERKEAGTSHFSCAIYYEADAFLKMMQQKSYKELVATVRYLQTLVPKQQQKAKTSRQLEDEEESSKFFVIVEGMDCALIELKKQQKQKKKSPALSTSPSPSMISFADLHEVAFQLFMDVGAHTKFTCDLEATANYVALLTRELVIASSRATVLEEFLESVSRYKSFRVTRSGGTASACANAWLRMLQVIPGVSEDKAQCLLDHFPTFDSLMRAYRDPRLSLEQKENLVADKLHDARIQRALSKRIYAVFCEENPDAII